MEVPASRRSWSTPASAATVAAGLLEGSVKDLTAITGQKPVIQGEEVDRRFQAREGNAIGEGRHLRNDRMWEFLDRLIALAIPASVTSGLPSTSFDGRGNYTFGVTEQLIFPRSTTTRSTRCLPDGHHHRDHRSNRTPRVGFCSTPSGSRSSVKGSQDGEDRL